MSLRMKVVGVLLSLMAGLMSCSNGEDATRNDETLVYPNSQVQRKIESSTATLYDPPMGDNSCPTSFTDYGTNDAPEEVSAFFEDRGFMRREGGRFDGGYRWVGIREGNESRWRKVDVADGATAGKPEWKTVYEVFEPDCG